MFIGRFDSASFFPPFVSGSRVEFPECKCVIRSYKDFSSRHASYLYRSPARRLCNFAKSRNVRRVEFARAGLRSGEGVVDWSLTNVSLHRCIIRRLALSVSKARSPGPDSPKMVQRHRVRGYEDFLKYVKDLRAATPIYMLYTGAKLPDTGESWCPDCVEAEPFIEKGFETAPEETLLVIVEVGDRPFWKDHNCPFRTNPVTKLKVLPTLAKWGTQKRLEGDQLLKPELIDMLLTDEDD